MEPNLTILSKALAAAYSRLQDCRAQIRAIAEADEYLEDIQRDEYLEDAAKELKACTVSALVAVRIVFELVGLRDTLRAFETEFAEVAETMGEVTYFDEYLGPHNKAVDLLSSRIDQLSPLIETPSEVNVQRRVLFRILRQMAHYIEGLGRPPTKEKDVQDALYSVLGLAFPDVIREPSIPKQTKTYCPDFGIGSLGAAVEVKYVDKKAKASLAIGGLYEDMKGYSASEYSMFVALVFMTSNFMTQDQVEAELKMVDTPKNWKVYLVVGPGGKTTTDS